MKSLHASLLKHLTKTMECTAKRVKKLQSQKHECLKPKIQREKSNVLIKQLFTVLPRDTNARPHSSALAASQPLYSYA